ncbi:D-cysteine desulfhydrase [Emticicia aquatica]|uniref:D-cysteine desulfhydrase n=1 Tax=Emticicia aquatica TaxID=1681835 RepID=A0ABN8ET75_9BACT|nr:pyridoxal-phosphate dependent enzyme [Emticicia aquatica]CAH0995160.1 D-cysteine desulfhydrase [Emticicia aquatica]
MREFSANSPFTKQISQLLHLPSPIQQIYDELFDAKALKVFVKRDDLIHSEISGNKWRKLKFNLLNASQLGIKSILTFGGAYSNHIYASAAAGKYFDFETIGVIRGDELNENSSSTLRFAAECGMKLHFVSREYYREIRTNPSSHPLIHPFKHSIIIPEGGTNEFALGGVGEMVEEITEQLGFAPDYIICPVGTGGTISGIIAKSDEKTKILGVCVLKNGHYLEQEINHLVEHEIGKTKDNFEILWNEHHGGYAKKTPELIDFIKEFERKHQIKIEPIYSGKMFYAFYESISKMIPPNSTVVLIHTGGIQN